MKLFFDVVVVCLEPAACRVLLLLQCQGETKDLEGRQPQRSRKTRSHEVGKKCIHFQYDKCIERHQFDKLFDCSASFYRKSIYAYGSDFFFSAGSTKEKMSRTVFMC